MDNALALIRLGIGFITAPLLVFASLCYWERFDSVAAATVYPPWCWAIAGICLACIGFGRRRRWLTATSIALWLIFLLAFADSPARLLRMWLPMPSKGENLRIISLNCASNPAAAREAMAENPDILLFQESPSHEDLEALAKEFFGPGNHVYWGGDASIVSRGEVTPVVVPGPLNGDFVHARVQVAAGSFDVISLRLFPSEFRMDLWSISCWQAFRANRETRWSEMQKIVGYVKTIPAGRPLVFGGDFNVPPGDAVLRALPAVLSDSFHEVGRGWGCTIINDCPAIRIDQIWHTGEIQPCTVVARKTQFSDHRMVVGEFFVDGH
jgi:hypothetical protein